MVLKEDAGFIQTWLQNRDQDWATNASAYSFGPYSDRGFEWSIEKHSDGSVAVAVSGPFGQSFRYDDIQAVPPSPGTDRPGKRVNLVIEWKDAIVCVRLNMVAVGTQHLAAA